MKTISRWSWFKIHLSIFFGDILCKLGIHKFHWKFDPDKGIRLSDPIPDDARCERCFIKYGGG